MIINKDNENKIMKKYIFFFTFIRYNFFLMHFRNHTIVRIKITRITIFHELVSLLLAIVASNCSWLRLTLVASNIFYLK